MKTKIIDQQANIVPYTIQESEWNLEQFKVRIKVQDKNVGEMRYSIQKYSLKINRMDNFTIDQPNPLKNVGTAFCEYAVKKSMKVGKVGHVELEAINKAGAAYYKMGFRKVEPATNFIPELTDYLNDPKEDLKAKIEKNSFYEALKQSATTNLYFKDQAGGVTDWDKFYNTEEFKKKIQNVNFDTVIKHGIYDVHNYIISKLLEEKKVLSAFECKWYLSGIMSLPNESIEILKNHYGIDDPSRAMDGILGDVVHFCE